MNLPKMNLKKSLCMGLLAGLVQTLPGFSSTAWAGKVVEISDDGSVVTVKINPDAGTEEAIRRIKMDTYPLNSMDASAILLSLNGRRVGRVEYENLCEFFKAFRSRADRDPNRLVTHLNEYRTPEQKDQSASLHRSRPTSPRIWRSRRCERWLVPPVQAPRNRRRV